MPSLYSTMPIGATPVISITAVTTMVQQQYALAIMQFAIWTTRLVGGNKSNGEKLASDPRHPDTYEDLLDGVEQTSFTLAVIEMALPPKFHAPTLPKFDGLGDPHKQSLKTKRPKFENQKT